ncbi:transcription initiation factor TFIIIB [Fredinandcohnia humi]
MKAKECPKCGSKAIGTGKQTGYSVMYPVNKMSLGSDIVFSICVSCGFIIESYVTKPEKFKDTM